MSVNITITNPHTGYSLESIMDQERYPKLMVNAKVIALLPALLIPVRTNTLKSFTVDFFLPTTYNHAIRVNGKVRKIFAILGALLLDTLTLSIRFLTCLPRYLYNSSRINPLYKGLQIGFANAFKTDYVVITETWKTYNEENSASYSGIRGSLHNIFEATRHIKRFNFHFIQVPQYAGFKFFEKRSEKLPLSA